MATTPQQRQLHPSTVAVIAGRPDREPGSPVNVPVHLNSVFLPGGAYEYSRVANPTWLAFEDTLGALEGGSAVSFASGMAAVAAVVEMLPAGGVVVAPSDCYHGIRLHLHDLESRARVAPRFVDISDTEQTLERCRGADLLWIESPTNPLMKVADVDLLSREAHAMGIRVAVDNTFATRVLQRPLDLGADVSVHSATKLLGGHSDLLMGAAVVKEAPLVEQLRARRTLHGGTPGSMEAFLALRGLRTLHLRIDRARATAAELARRLLSHPAVHHVRYPLIRGPRDDRSGTATQRGGTLVAFDVRGGPEAADDVCAATRMIVHGTSLGGVETLIDRRARWPIEDDTPLALLRLSVVCEDVQDLWEDLDQALTSTVMRA